MLLRRLRFPVLAALVVSIPLLVGACGGGGGGGGTSGKKDSGPKTIAINEYSREIPYFQEILKGMQQQAKQFKYTIQPTFANNDPTQQINEIQNAVTKRPDGLVVIPIDENAIVPPILAAKQANIPVISMGDNIAEKARDAQLAFLGVNYKDLGAEKAKYIIDQLKGKGTVGWIHGIRGLNFSEQQRNGATPVFKAAKGIKLVDGPYTGAFSSDKGLSATENLLSRAPKLDAIYFDNDDIALGGIQALQGRGIKPSQVLTVGTDGGPAALDAVQKGQLSATYSLCGFAQGKQAIDLFHNLFANGQKPQPTIYTQTLLFTPQNVAENIKKVRSGDC